MTNKKECGHGVGEFCSKCCIGSEFSPSLPIESLREEKPMEQFYQLYLEGQRSGKAPQSYVDYFKAGTLWLNILTKAVEKAQEETALFWVKETRKNEREKIAKEIEGLIKKQKPTHGTCCTCQECGYANDNDCRCPRNEVLEEVLVALKENK